MALKPKCDACNELKEDAPSFVTNGLTKTACTSLKNNTGLVQGNGNNNCTDLDNLNDCIIGSMDKEIELYSSCNWKDFMKKLIPNLWTMFKAFNCSMCGIWTNINKLWCWVEHLAEPNQSETLAPDDPKVRFRAVEGVVLRYDPQNPRPNDSPLRITAIGSTARVTGSLKFDGNMPADYTSGNNGGRRTWLSYFKGANEFQNRYGRTSYDGNLPAGGVLLYEYEVKSCDWGFSNLYNAPLFPAEAGNFIARIITVKSGGEYPYDCGWDSNGKGQIYTPTSDKFDTLIQIRLEYITSWGNSQGSVTPNGTVLIKPCTDSWDC